MLTKKELLAAMGSAPDNAVVFADLGDGELRGIHSVEFDPTPLPDTDHPLLTLNAQEA